jgi:hypothetical protein
MFQQLIFQSAAHYWQSKSLKALAEDKGQGYGVEIAHLRISSKIVRQAVAMTTLKKGGVTHKPLAASALGLQKTVDTAKV